jgi:1,4-dihydroxy-2-naphthoate polyprenyltransferase
VSGTGGTSAAGPAARAGKSGPRGLRIWLMAARPRTLPAAVAPVLVGTALAGYLHVFHPLRLVAALLSALFIQVGTNLSNDYSDARRGADTEDRLGPVRVTAGGLVPPQQVLIATYLSFGLAVVFGLYLVIVAGWQLLVLGVASIAAGVLYTGGPRPYGYEGLGEVFVFLFFGLVAVAGTFFSQTLSLGWAPFALAIPVGLLAAAILVVNNTRDLDTDRRAGKRTLAVRMGRARSRVFYGTLLTLAYVLLVPIVLVSADHFDFTAWLLLPWLAIPLAARLIRTLASHTDGLTLNQVLAGTGQLQLIFCVLLSAGLLLSR